MEDTNTSRGGGGVTVVGSDAPSDYHVAARATNETKRQATETTSLAVTISPAPSVFKKKRGRPRKYGPDGSVVAKALSPKPISSSAPPPVIDFSSVGKRGKIRPVILAAKVQQQQPRVEPESPGEWVSRSVGANFTPHIIAVNAGEDVMNKVISFSQQGPRAICILSANGIVSSATLRQPDSSGGTLTYEGRFEILSLSGSFMPAETGGMRNRSGGMSVSLSSPDGRVVGGGVAGLLVAASPVQIVVGSFLAGNEHEQLAKKQNRTESPTVIPASSISIPSVVDAHHSSTFRSDSWSATPPNTLNKPADINVTLPA